MMQRKRNRILVIVAVLAVVALTPFAYIAFRRIPGTPPVPPANPQMGQVWKLPKDQSVEMVYVPEGEFTMGRNVNDNAFKDAATSPNGLNLPRVTVGSTKDEEPARKVSLSGYWIGKTPVTTAQYRSFCSATLRRMPEPPKYGAPDDCPIENVTWENAKAYCEWVGGRLPTEAEWEKAARGTDNRVYPWGNEFRNSGAYWEGNHPEFFGQTPNYLDRDPAKQMLQPVGVIPGGASPYGCLDMMTNVFEWCSDYYDKDYYKHAPYRDPQGPESGSKRIYRGNARLFIWEVAFRCSARHSGEPNTAGASMGFRVAFGNRTNAGPQSGTASPSTKGSAAMPSSSGQKTINPALQNTKDLQMINEINMKFSEALQSSQSAPDPQLAFAVSMLKSYGFKKGSVVCEGDWEIISKGMEFTKHCVAKDWIVTRDGGVDSNMTLSHPDQALAYFGQTFSKADIRLLEYEIHAEKGNADAERISLLKAAGCHTTRSAVKLIR